MTISYKVPVRVDEERGDRMQTVEDVGAMLRLYALGWGIKRIARELGVSKNTVRRYLRQGGWAAYRKAQRERVLAGQSAWLAERFRRHRGNAEVVRQDLAREHGIEVSLRTVERAVAPLRQALTAEAQATVRFETAPGRQLQIDFGATRVAIGGERLGVHLFVATLGYSRRLFVAPFRHERQSAWLAGIEGAFYHFDGVPEELLLDNARALVERHDPSTREVVFNERLRQFAAYWGVGVRACAPYRARTKGKDERGVGYVKRNAIAGHEFPHWEAFEAHLLWWMREVADSRVHGTTGEVPCERFVREEHAALRPLAGRAPFCQLRECVRRVHRDACIELDTNRYSVPWRLIGCEVRVTVQGTVLNIAYAGEEVARHALLTGSRQRHIEPRHLQGIVGAAVLRPAALAEAVAVEALPTRAPVSELLRPLAEYEAAVGGAW